MWGAIANMIIKAADNMNRGAENATKAGEGNNGQNYQIEAGDVPSGGGSSFKPTEQDTSGAQSVANAGNKIANIGKNALSNIGKDEGGNDKGEGTENGADAISNVVPKIGSDERLKNIFGENEDAIKCFAKLDAIKFTYNDKAKEIHPNGENQVDDDIHYGVKAQDLEKNPLTRSAVSEDASGYKQVDPAELTMANSAVISEICKRIEILEKLLGVKVV